MAHFGLENEVATLTRMDAPLTKVPLMRFQRNSGVAGSGSLLSGPGAGDSFVTLNSSRSDSSIANISVNSKTPTRMLKTQTQIEAIGARKTPGRSPRRSSKTPNKSRTPGCSGEACDRFIPNRSATQFDLGSFLVTNRSTSADPLLSPSKQQFQKIMNENLNGELVNSKIIAYKQKPPQLSTGQNSAMKVLYTHIQTPSSVTKPMRHIPQAPERILDAPELLDDYYLNLLEWSSQNLLAVCLGPNVYLWNAGTGDITQLMEMDGAEEYISSVSWIKEGNHLAIGTSTGEVQLWDVERRKKLRCMTGHASRVGSLSWNSYVLSSGSRSGQIHHHDVRVASHLIGSLAGHSQEVCGLKWSPDGRLLASGGNDNVLNLWPADNGQCYSTATPVYTFTQHQAAVKALAWCPWQPSLLASGGGTADRNIRFWNTSIGSCLTSVDTNSQVCALLWSKEYKELVSSHGFAQNQLIIWRYPSLTKVAELTGHTSRVLHMAMSPDGSTVVSAAADETLRLWKCFAPSETQKKAQKSASKSDSGIMLRHNIR